MVETVLTNSLNMMEEHKKIFEKLLLVKQMITQLDIRLFIFKRKLWINSNRVNKFKQRVNTWY